MPKHVIDVSILREEYDAFVEIDPTHNCFPGTHDEWLEDYSKKRAVSISKGWVIDEVIVHPQELTEYARTTGQPISRVLLEATAVWKRARRK